MNIFHNETQGIDETLSRIVHIPMSLLYFITVIFLFSYLLFFLFCNVATKFHSRKLYFISLFLCCSTRTIYYLLNSIINPKTDIYLYEFSFTLSDIGSTFFYFGLFFFIIHWSENFIGSGGMSEELVEKKLRFPKLLLYLSILLIGFLQFGISILRITLSHQLHEEENIDIPEIIQSAFHSFLCIYVLVLLIGFSIWAYKMNSWDFGINEQKKFRAKFMFFVGFINGILMLLRILVNIVIIIGEVVDHDMFLYVHVIVNSLFPIVFDLFPTFLIVISITRGIFRSIRHKKRESKLLLHKVADSPVETNTEVPKDDEEAYQQD